MEIEEAKRRAKAGPAFLFIKRGFAILVGFLTTVTIAHFVAPREYGLANMAAVIFSFAQIFRDFGLTNAVLRKGDIDQSEMSLIFWFNCFMTLSLSAIIALMARSVAYFYHESIVTDVILVSLIGFVIDGCSLQHRSLIDRDLRFGSIATIDIAGLTISYVVTLVLAMRWHNVWAIVLGSLAQAVVCPILCVVVSGWKPSAPKKHQELGSLLKFGANTSVFSISVFASQNIAAILIGHFLGPAPLGQYSRAQSLSSLPVTNLIQPIAHATMPLLRHLRSDADEYRKAYLELVGRLSLFTVPLSVILFFAAPPLVEALLGNRWSQAGQVFAIMELALAGMAIGYSASDLFVTQDRSAELRTIGLLEMVLRVSCVAIGVQFGLLQAAIGFSLSTLVAAALRLYVSGRSGPVSSGDQLRAMAPSFPIAIGAAIGSGVGQFLISSYGLPIPVRASIVLVLGTAGALCFGLMNRQSRRALVDLVSVLGVSRGVAAVRKRVA